MNYYVTIRLRFVKETLQNMMDVMRVDLLTTTIPFQNANIEMIAKIYEIPVRTISSFGRLKLSK